MEAAGAGAFSSSFFAAAASLAVVNAEAFIIAVFFPANFSFLTAERGIEDDEVVVWSLMERR